MEADSAAAARGGEGRGLGGEEKEKSEEVGGRGSVIVRVLIGRLHNCPSVFIYLLFPFYIPSSNKFEATNSYFLPS